MSLLVLTMANHFQNATKMKIKEGLPWWCSG